MIKATATEIFGWLTRMQKLALAKRDEREIRRMFEDAHGQRIYDTVVSDAVLVACDRYAAKVRA